MRPVSHPLVLRAAFHAKQHRASGFETMLHHRILYALQCRSPPRHSRSTVPAVSSVTCNCVVNATLASLNAGYARNAKSFVAAPRNATHWQFKEAQLSMFCHLRTLNGSVTYPPVSKYDLGRPLPAVLTRAHICVLPARHLRYSGFLSTPRLRVTATAQSSHRPPPPIKRGGEISKQTQPYLPPAVFSCIPRT
jgi:hypothetical protein